MPSCPTQIRGVREALPDLAGELAELEAKLVDLKPVVELTSNGCRRSSGSVPCSVPALSRNAGKNSDIETSRGSSVRPGGPPRVPHLAVDLPEAPVTETHQARSLPRVSGKAGIVVEALIEMGRRDELVYQPEIAELSGSTQAWTSRVFRELVREGALEVLGRGPAKEWRPKLDELLRLWIADGGPSPAVTGTYLRTRTPSDLLRAVGQIGKDGLSHAIGGVAAADLHEPTLTSVPR